VQRGDSAGESRVGSRQPASTSAWWCVIPAGSRNLPDAEAVVASYDDADALARTLDGVETLLFVSAAESPKRLDQHFTVIDAAASAGVQHVVYTHDDGRRRRDPRSCWVGPCRSGRAGRHRRRRGGVLQDVRVHAGRAYELTGPAALTLAEVAAALTKHLGREVRYVPETVEEAYRSREKYGAERWQVDAWVSTYTAIRDGELAHVTSHVADVAGHPPRDLSHVLNGLAR
jgi:uncharacterized protein YbjT (DUF2867 family)